MRQPGEHVVDRCQRLQLDVGHHLAVGREPERVHHVLPGADEGPANGPRDRGRPGGGAKISPGMPASFRLTVVSAAWDPVEPDPEALLDRSAPLTRWCDAMDGAGVPVAVVQRFSRPAELTRGAVRYHFVTDDLPPRLAAGDMSRAVTRAVLGNGPDVVHVNGLGFPMLVGGLRAALGPRPLIVVQDHGGAAPPHGRGWIDRWRHRRWATGLAGADAVSFTAAAQAVPWRAAGILDRQDVLALVGGSSTVHATARDEARRRTNLSGEPLVLTVGPVSAATDPLTVLNGFERFAVKHPQARLVIASRGGALYGAVRSRIDASPVLLTTVRLLGEVADGDRGDLYGAADVFVSGSHHDGSGSTLIDALACGVLPVVTPIPVFDAIAGTCGQRFPRGDAGACAEALARAAAIAAAQRRADALAHFERTLAWPVLAAQTRSDYETLLARRRRSRT